MKEMHGAHVAHLGAMWQALLGKQQDLQALEERSSGRARDLRAAWEARVLKLESSTAASIEELEAKVAATKRKSKGKQRDAGVLQHILAYLQQ